MPLPDPDAPHRARGRRPLPVVLAATVVLCLAVREWYPFSPFPMYARFGPATWHVLVTDGADRIVPTESHFGIGAMPLRRLYETRLVRWRGSGLPEAQARARAAAEVLRFLRAEAQPRTALPAPAHLRLWRVVSVIDGERITQQREVVGELVTP